VTEAPLLDLTDDILAQVREITDGLAHVGALLPTERRISLRRANRIRTVHASLAVEGNTLDLDEVEAVLDGRQVVGPAREIQGVRNALDAYERMSTWNPQHVEDLCSAHGVLTKGLVDRPGAFRRGAAGIAGGEQIVHVAPPADRVPYLVRSLLGWLAESTFHPLVQGCVFHYELEFIHPFEDGNGRLGRLWQTLILSRWDPLCALLPVEHVVRDRQSAYYAALRQADRVGRSTPFVSFMLGAILDALAAATPQVTPQVERLLEAVDGEMSRNELQGRLGLSDRKHFRAHYLEPAVAASLIEMTIPDRPRSSKQRYRLTSKGRRWLEDLGGRR
jgi:Fic family protein